MNRKVAITTWHRIIYGSRRCRASTFLCSPQNSPSRAEATRQRSATDKCVHSALIDSWALTLRKRACSAMLSVHLTSHVMGMSSSRGMTWLTRTWKALRNLYTQPRVAFETTITITRYHKCTLHLYRRYRSLYPHHQECKQID